MWLNLKMILVLFTLFPLALCLQSFSFRQGLTILDKSFDKDTSLRGQCDLILLTPIEESEYDGHRKYYTLSSANALHNLKQHLTKSESHCLILVTSGKSKLEHLMQHAQQIQMIRPVSVLMMDIPKRIKDTTTFPTLDLRFPVIFLQTDRQTDNAVLLCPSVSKELGLPRIFKANYGMLMSCPSAYVGLMNSEIMTTHVGMIPKLVRGIKGLKGSIFSLMDLMSKKYKFRYMSIPAKSFSGMVYNVSVKHAS